MLSPFLVSHLKIPYPIPLPPAHYPWPLIPLHWGIEPSQDQGPFFPLMSDKAILCYICGWSHGSLHVYSFVHGLVPGSSGGSGWFLVFIISLLTCDKLKKWEMWVLGFLPKPFLSVFFYVIGYLFIENWNIVLNWLHYKHTIKCKYIYLECITISKWVFMCLQ